MSPQVSEPEAEVASAATDLMTDSPGVDFGELDGAQRFEWIQENHGG